MTVRRHAAPGRAASPLPANGRPPGYLSILTHRLSIVPSSISACHLSSSMLQPLPRWETSTLTPLSGCWAALRCPVAQPGITCMLAGHLVIAGVRRMCSLRAFQMDGISGDARKHHFKLSALKQVLMNTKRFAYKQFTDQLNFMSNVCHKFPHDQFPSPGDEELIDIARPYCAID